MSALRSAVLCGALVVSLAIGAASAGASTPDPNYQPLPKPVVHEVTSVSAATLAVVGVGKRHGGRNVPPSLVHDATLSQHGKPLLDYLIAEWCPFCASESWSVAVALSRFGNVDGLTTLASPARDGLPAIQTVSFRYATFTSKYFAFDPIVYADPDMKRVDSVPVELRKPWHRQGSQGLPFLDFGGKAVGSTSFLPKLLAHLTRAQIAADLSQPKRRVAKAIDGSANQITAAICVMTGNKPVKICQSKTIAAIEHSLRPYHASF
jgi:Domain of unknown function (DUF929)